MTDDAIHAASVQRMPGLDRHQSAEPPAKNKHGPESQCAAGDEETNAKPTNSITVEYPQFFPEAYPAELRAYEIW